ncbi:MAG: aminotransferase class IV [Phycisphaerae bacterium]
MAHYINVNGQILPVEEAAVSPSDAGLLHGAGLFETMRVQNGKVFRGRQHIERLMASAQVLGIPVSLTAGQLQEMATDLCEVNHLTDARLRLTITRGDLQEATADNPVPPVTLILSAADFQPYAPAMYEKGMTVIVSRYKQNPDSPLNGHKTTSYFDRLLALKEAQEMKANEALWFTAHANYLAEGSISNVFIVDKEGTLATPPLALPEKAQRLCLPGITRQVVLELATAMNHLPHERLLTINDLLAAKEVFLTNAIMGVMPVSAIEKHSVNGGKVGDLTKKLREGYDGAVQAETA